MNILDMLHRARTADAEHEAAEAHAVDLDGVDLDHVPVLADADNAALLDALRQVIDPELGINIVDLGLVYALAPRDGGVDVVLTMTTPACPLSALIEDQVKDALRAADADLTQVRVAIVFEPPWQPSMMSDAARAQLGG